MESDPVGYREWEDGMFHTRWYFDGTQGNPGEVYDETRAELETMGVDPLTIELLPDSVAHLVESASEYPGVVAPRLHPDR